MAKGQHLSAYQQKIVQRYYDNIDTISLQKLSEAVGEIYLCEDDKKADRLWTTVENALKKFKLNPAKVAPILKERDVKALAALVATLTAKK